MARFLIGEVVDEEFTERLQRLVSCDQFFQPSRSRGEVPDEDLGLCSAGVGGHPENLVGDILGDVGLTAVLTDVRRDFVDNERLISPVKCHRGGPIVRVSVMTNDALHRRFFLRVINPGSHSSGSGR